MRRKTRPNRFDFAQLEPRLLLTGDLAGTANDGLTTPADTIHPNIHQNNGPQQNANPNGANDGGGNMHGIANVPGQNGDNPNNDGVSGFANELNTVHGGIGTVNQNAG